MVLSQISLEFDNPLCIGRPGDKDVRKGRIRLSTVSTSESGLSSAVIARKNQKGNNPVRAMLDRFNKARIESQTKDIEDQLSLLTGEEPNPSTSADAGSKGRTGGSYLPEGVCFICPS